MEARDLFEYLVAEEKRKVEKVEKTHVYRGPFLARMELVRQLRDRKLLGELDLEIGESGERSMPYSSVLCVYVCGVQVSALL